MTDGWMDRCGLITVDLFIYYSEIRIIPLIYNEH